MAVPQTSSYLPNRGRIVQLALTNVGAIGPGSVNPAQDAAPFVAHANDTLNILMKSMDSDGILTWRDPRRTVATVASQSTYTPADDVIDIEGPLRYTVAGQTSATPIYPMSKKERMETGDLTLTGTPIQYIADKSIDPTTGLQSLTIALYPIPTNTGDTVEYTAIIRARDQSTDADTLDVATLWVRCLVYGLSADLAPGYGLDMNRIQYFQKLHEDERQRCLEQDSDHGDVQIIPWGGSAGYGYGYGHGGGR